MNLLMDPNVAYVLLVLGLVLGVLSLFAPGTGFLEIGALFALVVAGISAVNMDINPWALIVLILGIVPFVFALRKWRNWLFLGIAIAALIVGSVFLFRNPAGGPAVNVWLATFVSTLAGGLVWIIARKGLEAISRRPDFDLGRLQEMTGIAHTNIFQEGSVYINGEEWSAWSRTPIPVETRVRIIGRQGLVLEVEAVEG
ncbi:MAG TPA: NfeD family protein [Bellilinea sp.]|nr:NfeD family protein [Bellilinea sp.]